MGHTVRTVPCIGLEACPFRIRWLVQPCRKARDERDLSQGGAGLGHAALSRSKILFHNNKPITTIAARPARERADARTTAAAATCWLLASTTIAAVTSDR